MSCDLSQLIRKLGECDVHPDCASHREAVGRDLEPLCAEAVHSLRETLLAPARRDAIAILAERLIPYIGAAEASKQAEKLFDKSQQGLGRDWLNMACQLQRDFSDTSESFARKISGVPSLLEAFRSKYAAQLPPQS